MSAVQASAEENGPTLNVQAAATAARFLYVIVFVSGAILMGVEIAGSRILAPGFGSSIFVWGSLIGLFMSAMALGYYAGGMLADRRPSISVLATIVSLAGLYAFLMIPYIGPWMCNGIAMQITDRAMGPLVASALLFFIPSFLMAMVSPYAVKLNASSLAGLGGVAGRLYAISTLGSVVGTLLTTFVFIPFFHVSHTLLGLGLGLIVVAVVGLVGFKRAVGEFNRDDRNGTAFMILVALACLEIWMVFPVEPFVESGQSLLHYEESTYHDIAVTDEVVSMYEREEGLILPPVAVRRWLKFNENVESGIYPYRLTYSNAVHYTDLLHLPLIWVEKPQRVLVIGGGGAIAPMQYCSQYGSHVDILELDPQVRDVARTYFKVNVREEQLRFHIGDARLNLRKMEGPYDVIILDAYSSGGQIPFHLLTWEFLHEVRAKLAENGVLATNIISGVRNTSLRGERPADLLIAEVKTLSARKVDFESIGSPSQDDQARLFDQVYVFPRVYKEENGEGSLRGREDVARNVICIATRETVRRSLEEIVDAAKRLTRGEKPRVKIDRYEFVWNASNFYEAGPSKEELESVPILRDNFAPVDTMYRPVKASEAQRLAY